MARKTVRARPKGPPPRRMNYTPWIIGGLVVAAAVVALLVWANQPPPPATPSSSYMAQCGQPTCGQANAPVTIDEYSDFQ